MNTPLRLEHLHEPSRGPANRRGCIRVMLCDRRMTLFLKRAISISSWLFRMTMFVSISPSIFLPRKITALSVTTLAVEGPLTLASMLLLLFPEASVGLASGAMLATASSPGASADKDMVCGVCLEVVFNKDDPRERRFGILPNCRHCYCLTCIRTWRSVKHLDNVKACPECRIRSPFFIPSNYWVEDEHEKQRLIQTHKNSMARKPCRYFNEGHCRFGSYCFYKHNLRERVQPPRGAPQQQQEEESRDSRTVLCLDRASPLCGFFFAFVVYHCAIKKKVDSSLFGIPEVL
uniref:RING-type E3 ubiquitin transferase n=1 Tax=Monopterus albus TaxID=43700 RepID=A0A3Q3JR68_MONAL